MRCGEREEGREGGREGARGKANRWTAVRVGHEGGDAPPYGLESC